MALVSKRKIKKNPTMLLISSRYILTNADSLVVLNFEALWTNTFITSFSVQALVTASPIVNSAFILICRIKENIALT